MTIDEAVEILNKGYTPRGDREAFKQYFFARKMAIRSLEAWDGLIDKIQSIKTMKEQELLTAGDLTTAYILQGEIVMLGIIKDMIKNHLSEVSE